MDENTVNTANTVNTMTTTTLEYIIPNTSSPTFVGQPVVPNEEEDIEGMDSMEMIEEMLQDMIKIELDTSDLVGTKIDKKEFEKGVKSISKVAGIFSCLKNIGMTEEAIVTYMLNERNIEHSQAMQKYVNDAQLEMAKIGVKTQQVMDEQNQI